MKHTLKQALAGLLVAVMAVALLPVMRTEANAAGVVQDRLNAVISEFPEGSYFTTDGNPNSSGELTDVLRARGLSTSGFDKSWTCLAFAKFVWARLFGHNVLQDYRIEIGSSMGDVQSLWAQAQPGDLVYFYNDKNCSDWRHAAIFLSKSGNSISLVDCNYNHTNQIKYYTATIGGWGWPHSYYRVYHANDYESVNGRAEVQRTPTNASVTTDKTTYTLGETVSITPTANGADHFTISILLDGSKEYGEYTGFTGTKIYRPTKAGTYNVVVSAVNSAGWTDAYCNFTVASADLPPAPTNTEYRYGRYVDPTGMHSCWCRDYFRTTGYESSLQYSDWSTTRYPIADTGWTCGYCNGNHIGAASRSDGRSFWNEYRLPSGSYYWEETRTVPVTGETQPQESKTVTYYLDVSGTLDGIPNGNTNNYGTFDVYVNGARVADDVTDYREAWPSGTSYEVKDIRAQSGRYYAGSTTMSGRIGGADANVDLTFWTEIGFSVKVEGQTVTLSWNAIPNRTWYCVALAEAGTGKTKYGGDEISPNTTSRTFTNVAAGNYFAVFTANNSKFAQSETFSVQSARQTLTAQLAAESKTASAGGTVTVPVKLTSNPGLTGFSFNVSYDSDKLELLNAEPGTSFYGMEINTDKPVRALWASGSQRNVTGNVTVMELTFRVKGGASGEAQIRITPNEAESESGGVALRAVNGAVTISASSGGLRGDVNGDGDITLRDVTSLRKYLVGMSVSVNTANADVNGDGSITLRDVTKLQKYLIGLISGLN